MTTQALPSSDSDENVEKPKTNVTPIKTSINLL